MHRGAVPMTIVAVIASGLSDAMIAAKCQIVTVLPLRRGLRYARTCFCLCAGTRQDQDAQTRHRSPACREF
jgi:hypothetical protein